MERKVKLPEIIGISGTNGAGKDTLAALRREKEGAEHVSLVIYCAEN